MKEEEISDKEKTECLKAIHLMLRKDLKENSYAGWTTFKGFQVPKYHVILEDYRMLAILIGLPLCIAFGALLYAVHYEKEVIAGSQRFFMENAKAANAYHANQLP